MAGNSGGKKGRKLGRNKVKCALYRATHGGGTRKKIAASKEHRSRGPIGTYRRELERWRRLNPREHASLSYLEYWESRRKVIDHG